MRFWSTWYISGFPLILMVNSDYLSVQNLLNNIYDKEIQNLLRCRHSIFKHLLYEIRASGQTV